MPPEPEADLIQALQLISQALGPDHDDDYERAVGAIKFMQSIAMDALRKHGIEPVGTPVEP